MWLTVKCCYNHKDAINTAAMFHNSFMSYYFYLFKARKDFIFRYVQKLRLCCEL